MKMICYYGAVALFAICLSACSHMSSRRMLRQADALMNVWPDSALCLLESISPQSLHTRADSALYALLLARAHDKKHDGQPSGDSLIRFAADYYRSVDDLRRLAEAYSCWGSVLRDANLHADALEKFHEASVYAARAGEKRLSGLICGNQGYIYLWQGYGGKADSVFAQMEATGRQLRDTAMWAEAVTMRGHVETSLNHYPQAEEKLLEAESLLRGRNRFTWQRCNLYSRMSTLYSRMRQGEKALHYAKQHLALVEDTLLLCNAYGLLMDAYYRVHLYDSARLYINKVFSAHPGYRDKMNAYMRLADMAKACGDVDGYSKYNALYAVYQDSFYHYVPQQIAVRDADHRFEQKQLLEQERGKRRTVAWIFGAVVAVLLGGAVYVRRRSAGQVRKLKAKCAALDNRLKEGAVRSLHDGLEEKIRWIAADEIPHKVLNGDDWASLAKFVDPGSCLHCPQYGLTNEERHYCYLLLYSEFKQHELALLLEKGVTSVYYIRTRILEKLGYGKGDSKQLRSILRAVVASGVHGHDVDA